MCSSKSHGKRASGSGSSSKEKRKRRDSKGEASSSSAPLPASADAAATAAGAPPSILPPTPAPAASPSAGAAAGSGAFPDEDSLPHLCCGICLSFPGDAVLQCASGHILCRECHDRVCCEEKPTCPTCRVALDPLKPIRNVLAEQTISLLPVACPNSPCAAKLTRGALTAHVRDQCPHRRAVCKYAPLGCKWVGIAQECSAHEDRCKRAELPGWKLLKKVNQRNADAEKAATTAAAPGAVALKILDMLGSRCKNIEVRVDPCVLPAAAGAAEARMGWHVRLRDGLLIVSRLLDGPRPRSGPDADPGDDCASCRGAAEPRPASVPSDR